MLTVEEFRRVCDSGARVDKEAEVGQNFDYYLFEAQKILAEMNTGYHTPDQLQELRLPPWQRSPLWYSLP